eukprot:g5110.t1
MPRKKSKRKQSRRPPQQSRPHACREQCSSFVADQGPGCYIAHAHDPSRLVCGGGWLVGLEQFRAADFGLEEDCSEEERAASLADVSVDPASGLLTVINGGARRKSYVLSVEEPYRCRDQAGRPLRAGWSSAAQDSQGKPDKQDRQDKPDRDQPPARLACTTFVLVVPALCVMDVCYLYLHAGAEPVAARAQRGRGPLPLDLDRVARCLQSDVTYLPAEEKPAASLPYCAEQLLGCSSPDGPVPAASLATAPAFSFPLAGPGPFLCSQGVCGRLTHFLPQTLHAIDLACPVGTPVLAMADGVVVDVKQTHQVSGIHVRNLFSWNSVTLRPDQTGGILEYVHIKAGSVQVGVGQRIKAGDVLCQSGDVGFCPTPHLHIQYQLSDAPDAPTALFAFAPAVAEAKSAAAAGDSDSAPPFLPLAGFYYNQSGVVPLEEGRKAEQERQQLQQAVQGRLPPFLISQIQSLSTSSAAPSSSLPAASVPGASHKLPASQADRPRALFARSKPVRKSNKSYLQSSASAAHGSLPPGEQPQQTDGGFKFGLCDAD